MRLINLIGGTTNVSLVETVGVGNNKLGIVRRIWIVNALHAWKERSNQILEISLVQNAL